MPRLFSNLSIKQLRFASRLLDDSFAQGETKQMYKEFEDDINLCIEDKLAAGEKDGRWRMDGFWREK